MADGLWVAKFQKPDTDPTAFSKPATTVLSPYLKFGCLSARHFYAHLMEVYRWAAVLLLLLLGAAAGGEMLLLVGWLVQLCLCWAQPHQPTWSLPPRSLLPPPTTPPPPPAPQEAQGPQQAPAVAAGPTVLARVLLHGRSSHAQLQPHGAQPRIAVADAVVFKIMYSPLTRDP
jgi:hypothetical protein